MVVRHDPHTGGGERSRISIVTVSVSRSTPRTSTSGRPTNSSHMRVGLDSTGAPRIGWRRNHQFFEPLSRARWTLTHLVQIRRVA